MAAIPNHDNLPNYHGQSTLAVIHDHTAKLDDVIDKMNLIINRINIPVGAAAAGAGGGRRTRKKRRRRRKRRTRRK